MAKVFGGQQHLRRLSSTQASLSLLPHSTAPTTAPTSTTQQPSTQDGFQPWGIFQLLSSSSSSNTTTTSSLSRFWHHKSFFTMSHISTRELLPFPPGANSSDTYINGHHFNLDTLKRFNYSYYSNNTVSNNTKCYLFTKPHIPLYLLEDGKFIGNHTAVCHASAKPCEMRSYLDLVFLGLVLLAFTFTCFNIQRKGKVEDSRGVASKGAGSSLHYWMTAFALFATGCILTGIWSDLQYLAYNPLIVSGVFWYVMLLIMIVCVWQRARIGETRTLIRENQLVDSHPYHTAGTPEPRMDITLKGIFILFYIAIFCLIAFRDWSRIKQQNAPDQIEVFAEPAVTDVRFKIAAFFLLGPWVLIFTTVTKSNRFGCRSSAMSSLDIIAALLLLAPINYAITSTFKWHLTPFNKHMDLGMYYGLGWTPFLIIMLLIDVATLTERNKDIAGRQNNRRVGGHAEHGGGAGNGEEIEMGPVSNRNRNNTAPGEAGDAGDPAGNTAPTETPPTGNPIPNTNPTERYPSRQGTQDNAPGSSNYGASGSGT